VKRDRIEVIYNHVDIQYIEASMKEPLAEPYEAIYTSSEKVIVTAGRLVKEKDHATLLRAFKQVTEQIPSHLVILGEGELESSLKALAKQLKIEPNVHFVGFQPNPYAFFQDR